MAQIGEEILDNTPHEDDEEEERRIPSFAEFVRQRTGQAPPQPQQPQQGRPVPSFAEFVRQRTGQAPPDPANEWASIVEQTPAPAGGEANDDAAKRAPEGFFGGALDLLARGQYASTEFVDTLAEEGIAGLGQALVNAVSEVVNPKERQSYSDLIKKYAPEVAERAPITTEVLGFVADVAFDPVTYLTFGIGNAPRITVAGVSRGLSSKGVREAVKLVTALGSMEAAEKKIAQVAVKNPELLIPKGLRVNFGIGKAKVSVSSPKFLNAATKRVADVSGLSRVMNALKQLKHSKAVETVHGAFVRNKDLPEEYIRHREQLLADAQKAQEGITQDVLKLFKGVSQESREKIGTVGSKIDDESAKLADELGRKLTPEEAVRIKERVLRQYPLSDKEFEIYSTMRRRFQEIALLETEAGLLGNEIANYFPRRYAALAGNADDIKSFQQLRQGSKLSDFLASSKQRKFRTLEQAREAGYVPELDAARLYTTRLLSSARALRNQQFNDSVQALKARVTAKQWKAIQNDMKFVGESSLDAFTSEEGKTIAAAWDAMTRWFKTGATVAKPGFGVRQIFSNLDQSYLIAGVKALKAFDPRRIVDTQFILNNVYKNTPEAQARLANIRFTSNLGEVITGADLAKEFADQRIIQGSALGGVRFVDDAVKELKRQDKVAAFARKTGVSQGVVDLASKALRYWRFPGMIEDHARGSLYLTARMIGHSPNEAKRLVNKALFDYTHGLSRIEKTWMKRIVPFYSFQRFAVPMAARAVGTAPGRIANTKKGVEAFFSVINKLSGGEDLTEAERHVLPGWLLEQPSAFRKFNLEGEAVFHSFNNFTPLDVMHFAETDSNGKTSIGRTVQKTILSTLSPFIKVPVELAWDRNFFTGRAVSQNERLGEKGAILGGLDKTLPDFVKQVIGWEKAHDPVDDKEMIYFNPYMMHIATSMFPAISEIIRVADARLSPMETALSAIAGVNTYHIDLKQQRQFKAATRQREIEEKKKRIYSALRNGRQRTAEAAKQDLQDLMQEIRKEFSVINSGQIRGVQ